MTREEAEEYANNMTYRDAINNLMKARSIPYRKATFIKVNELLKTLKQEPIRDATPEERESIDKYIKSISKPTGVDFWDLADGEYISRQQARSEYADWYGYGYQDNWFYKRLGSMSSVAIPPEHDGCKDCKYATYPEYYYPCCDCKQNYIDKWERAKHWIHRNDDSNDWLECPNCGYGSEGEVKYGEGTPFCPQCGERLEEK